MALFGPPRVDKLTQNRDVNGLIKALGHRDDDVRRDAALALGQLEDPQALEPLIAALGQDADSKVRMAAARALGGLGDARAVEPLTAALGSRDEDLREIAAKALETFLPSEKTVELVRQAEIDAHAAVLHDTEAGWGDRRAAVVALGKLRDPRAVVPLLAAGEDMRLMVQDSLQKLGEPAVEPLIVALGRADAESRVEAALALGELGDARAVEPLLATLDHSHNDVRMHAIEALGKLGDSRAVEALFVTLRHHEPKIRTEAILALGKLGDSRAVEPLVDALTKDPDANVRKAAATALGGLGDARAAEPLVSVLKQAARARNLSAHGKGRPEDIEIGEVGVEAARELGFAHMMEPLTAAVLREQNRAVRENLEGYLRRIGGQDAERALADHRARSEP